MMAAHNSNLENEHGKDGDVVATTEMCHHCFDVLLRRLLPSEAAPDYLLRDSVRQREQEELPMGGSRTTKSDDGEGDDHDGNDEGRPHIAAAVGATARSDLFSSSTFPSIKCPFFVTWDKLRSGHSSSLRFSSRVTTPTSSNITDDDNSASNNSGMKNWANGMRDDSDFDLRGCIGTLAPRPLHRALGEFALTSALRDQRFDPISLEEVPLLRVAVSLLVKYEECLHCHDWVVGVHGIIIRFECGNGRPYSATYLPSVAFEQRWNQEETIMSLVRKAGYHGVIHDDFLSGIRCTRYQSSICHLTYQEHVDVKCKGRDPLQNVDVIRETAVDGTIKQRLKTVKPCVNL